MPIHQHPTKDETFVILRGKVRVTAHRDDGSIIEDVVLSAEEGRYGVNILKGVWHKIEALEPDTLSLSAKRGRSQDSQARMSDQRSSVWSMKWMGY